MVDLITPPPALLDDGPHEDHGHDEHHGATGILKWMTSTDHKVIGLSYTVTSVVMLVIGGLFAEIIRAQLASPNGTLVSLAQYNELFTMHGSVMIYLFAGPFAFGGLANIIVPIQIGAPDMAFPRLTALSYWLYLMGSITMLMGFFTAGGAANFGWVAYPPLSNSINTPGGEKAHQHGDRSHEIEPVGERVQSREGHVRRADLDRHDDIGEAAEGEGSGEEVDHHRAVHREQFVVLRERHQRPVGCGQLRANDLREQSTNDEHDDRGHGVGEPDDLVVGCRHPLQNSGRAVVLVVTLR